MVKSEKLNIVFYDGPKEHNAEHILLTPLFDVKAFFDLYNTSETVTTTEFAFPVIEGKWKPHDMLGRILDEKNIKKWLPRNLSISFNNLKVNVTKETVDISLDGLLGKKQLQQWNKDI